MPVVPSRRRPLLAAGFLTVGAVAILAAGSGYGYSTLATLRERANARWGDLQSQYARRAELVPTLASALRDGPEREEALDAVLDARAEAASLAVDAAQLTDSAKVARFEAAEDRLTAALGGLLAIRQGGPPSATDGNVVALRSRFEDAETGIVRARRDFVAASRAFNARLRTFPASLWASLFLADPRPIARPVVTEEPGKPAQAKPASIGPKSASATGVAPTQQ